MNGDYIDSETKAAALQDIENDAARMQHLIENVLVLARLEGAADFEAEPVLLQRMQPRLAEESHAAHPSCGHSRRTHRPGARLGAAGLR